MHLDAARRTIWSRLRVRVCRAQEHIRKIVQLEASSNERNLGPKMCGGFAAGRAFMHGLNLVWYVSSAHSRIVAATQSS